MKINSLFILILLSFGFSFLAEAVTQNRRALEPEKEYTFPGTGFLPFLKNRSPYEDKDAQRWFGGGSISTEGSTRKALSLYEKFSKRRSDAKVSIRGNLIQVGPEALYRASILREKKEIGIRLLSIFD